MSLPQPAFESPAAVLDTNALLDWLVFADSRITALAAAVESGAARWLACASMRDELARLLGHAKLARWSPDAQAVLARFDRLACLKPVPASLPALRCTDPDDQVFIDLAVAQGARWLVTHDRALLRLARRAGRHGVRIVQPVHWSPE